MLKMLVEIDKTKKSDDELDAIAVALTAFAHKRFWLIPHTYFGVATLCLK